MRMNNFFLSVFTSSPLPRPQDAVVEGGVLLLPLSTVLFFRLGTRPRLVRGWAEKITPCDYFLPNTRMWSSARFYRKTERKKLFIPSTLHSGVFCIVALAKPVLLLYLLAPTGKSYPPLRQEMQDAFRPEHMRQEAECARVDFPCFYF